MSTVQAEPKMLKGLLLPAPTLQGVIGVSDSMLLGSLKMAWDNTATSSNLQQREYDALTEIDPDIYYFITG